MTEDQLEQEALGLFQELGYARVQGPGVAHDGSPCLSEDVLQKLRRGSPYF